MVPWCSSGGGRVKISRLLPLLALRRIRLHISSLPRPSIHLSQLHPSWASRVSETRRLSKAKPYSLPSKTNILLVLPFFSSRPGSRPVLDSSSGVAFPRVD